MLLYLPVVLLTLTMAAAKDIIIRNLCSHDLHATYQTNTEPYGKVFPLPAKSNKTITVDNDWEGRVWAQESCHPPENCLQAGAHNPASLAEFKMSGANNVDYYDISFVDGYNLPLRVEPTKLEQDHTVSSDPRHCRATYCSSMPDCPADLRFQEGKTWTACQSACSRYRQDEYCCTGAHSTPETCTSNHFSRAIKAVCSDVYTYAFDDAFSVYACHAPSYIVSFCP